MILPFHDFYKTLGVDPSASREEIASAFRKLAWDHHWSVGERSGDEAHFKEIYEAYKVLKDPEKRSEYDTLNASWENVVPFHGGSDLALQNVVYRTASWWP